MKKIFKIVGAVVLVLIVVTGLVCWLYGMSGPWVFTEERTVVEKTGVSERRAVVSVVNVLKEKNKEDIYFVKITDAEWESDVLENKIELTESEYNKYVGEGNDCITYKYGYCVIETKDSLNWKSRYCAIERWCFPWENEVVEFSENEIKAFRKTFVQETGNISTPGDLPISSERVSVSSFPFLLNEYS